MFRDNEILKSKIKELEDFGACFSISTITLCELYRGAFLSIKTNEALELISNLVRKVIIFSLEDESCRIYGETYNSLKKQDKLTNEFDLMIASIAKANNLILVTRNKKHFENIDIKIEVW